MSDKTLISWADATWSPVTGCTRISEGCLNCYIERTPPFRMTGRRFDLPIVGGTTGVELHPDRLTIPLHWRKPRRVFVCSLADLFHEAVPDAYIAEVFTTMARAPQHTFQVLSKRHGRLKSLLSRRSFRDNLAMWGQPWPLPNVWVGASVENQQWADTRIPALLDTPAAVRWLSCEPLLGPVDLARFLHLRPIGKNLALRPLPRGAARALGLRALDWLVAGGESGKGARPADPTWFRSLRDQCAEAEIPFHFKQWGEWVPGGFASGRALKPNERLLGEAGDPHRRIVVRVGKSRAGRHLDGRTWDEYPEVARG